MAGISSITGSTVGVDFQFSAQNTQTGSAYTGQIASASIRKRYNLGTAAANSASGGADEVFSFQQTIAPGGSLTLDLLTMTNVLAQATILIARVKSMLIRLLSADDDSTITVPAASAVNITNAVASVPHPLDFQPGGSGLTVTLTTAAGAVTGVGIGAGGTGYPVSTTLLVVPQQTAGSGCLLSVVTNGSGVCSSVTVLQAGTGYTNGTVAGIVAGHRKVGSGGATCYFDVSAAGFATVSATSRNITVQNLDAVHTATLEFDFFACST